MSKFQREIIHDFNVESANSRSQVCKARENHGFHDHHQYDDTTHHTQFSSCSDHKPDYDT